MRLCFCFIVVLGVAEAQVGAELPSYQSSGGGPQQIIRPGKPWPSSPEEYANFSQTQKPLDFNGREGVQEATTVVSLGDKPKPQTSQTEKPVAEFTSKPIVKPSFSPRPIGLIVQSGQPWPSNAEGYANFSKTTEKTPDIVDRFKETTAKPPGIDLEYKPNRPSFHPNPGDTLGQIVPPGQPWPSNAEDYANFSQTTEKQPNLADRIKETDEKPVNQPSIVLEYKPTRPPFHPNPGDNIAQIVPPGQPWPSNAEDYANFSQTTEKVPNLADRIKETDEKPVNQPSTVLEYKPTRPPFHPNPGDNIAPIVPPGQPWPSNAEDYANFSQTTEKAPNLFDRIKDETVEKNEPKPQITLDYKPIRPFHLSKPSDSQIIPPGKPWPSNAADYANFSQTPKQPPSLADRFNADQESSTVSNFHPKPGESLGQIIPPGKPWPASLEDYKNFSQTTPPPPTKSQTYNNIAQIVPPGKPWPGKAEENAQTSTSSSELEVTRKPQQEVSPQVVLVKFPPFVPITFSYQYHYPHLIYHYPRFGV